MLRPATTRSGAQLLYNGQSPLPPLRNLAERYTSTLVAIHFKIRSELCNFTLAAYIAADTISNLFLP